MYITLLFLYWRKQVHGDNEYWRLNKTWSKQWTRESQERTHILQVGPSMRILGFSLVGGPKNSRTNSVAIEKCINLYIFIPLLKAKLWWLLHYLLYNRDLIKRLCFSYYPNQLVLMGVCSNLWVQSATHFCYSYPTMLTG